MSKLRELVGIVSYLSGKPLKAVSQVQVDEALSVDVDAAESPSGSADVPRETAAPASE